MNKRPIFANYLSFSIALLVVGFSAISYAVDFSGVPGQVLDYQPLTYDLFYTTPRAFISDPEIVVLTNGNYIAAHALAGRNSGSDTSGITSLFRSTDKGTNWSLIGTFNGMLRGSLFIQNGALYLLGANKDVSGNNAVIMQSLDNGTNWTTASLTKWGGPGTPNNPVVFSNTLWSAGSISSYSASINSNLLVEASWKLVGGFPATTSGWLTGSAFVGEGQVVASPRLGVLILPKISGYHYTALSRVEAGTGTVWFDPTNNFVALPGAEKKFGAAYDLVSSNFYVLSNPILPVDTNSSIAPELIRNVAAVLSSRDLFNWKVEKIFLYSSDIDREGFGYLNCDFDGSNLVAVARTAFKLSGETYPTRGHDSNLLTFHRINDFRNLAPDQYLMISNNQVLRYERTQYQSAPLGSFTLGSTFAGAALIAPSQMGKTIAGDVYIQEAGGRILHFDSSGNYIETTNSAPVTLQPGILNVKQPTNGECSWVSSGSGDWSELLNWHYWGRPDTTEEIAVFGSAATAAATITIPSATQTWAFNTDGNQEGWLVSSASNTVVSGGFLQGAANTASSVVNGG